MLQEKKNYQTTTIIYKFILFFLLQDKHFVDYLLSVSFRRVLLYKSLLIFIFDEFRESWSAPWNEYKREQRNMMFYGIWNSWFYINNKTEIFLFWKVFSATFVAKYLLFSISANARHSVSFTFLIAFRNCKKMYFFSLGNAQTFEIIKKKKNFYEKSSIKLEDLFSAHGQNH